MLFVRRLIFFFNQVDNLFNIEAFLGKIINPITISISKGRDITIEGCERCWKMTMHIEYLVSSGLNIGGSG